MARVYLEYGKRILLEYPDYFMFAFFAAAAFMLVSVRSVFVNLVKTVGVSVSGGDWSGIFSFLFTALRDTSWVMQAFIAGLHFEAGVFRRQTRLQKFE